MAQARVPQQQASAWALEVVRGRDVGRVFPVPAGELVLGGGPGVGVGLDLREQEADSPRRMAARQAAVEGRGAELTIRDLDSPGGTFVNGRRLLSGQVRRLEPGDVIQLGAVQLRVSRPVAAAADRASTAAPGRAVAVNPRVEPPPLPSPDPAGPPTIGGQGPAGTPGAVAAASAVGAGRLPVAFAMAGTSCRCWDDFLVVAAQRWRSLADELASGRLSDYLRRIDRRDLIPQPAAGLSTDEQLDRWLARIPATRPSAPELDVHPDRLDVRAVGGGGVTRQVLRITNVGYRLLRCTARVEPTGTSWIRLAPGQDGRPFDTIEETELPVEVTIPETLDAPLSAAIVLESNGGIRHVVVRVERPGRQPDGPEPGDAPGDLRPPEWIGHLVTRLSRFTPAGRVVAGVLCALMVRAVAAVSALVPLGVAGSSSFEARPLALAVLCASAGLVVGVMLVGRGRDVGPVDRLAAGVAGGLFGVIAAAILHAMVRTVEWPLGSWSTSAWAVGLLWAGLGAAVGGISGVLIPYRRMISPAGP